MKFHPAVASVEVGPSGTGAKWMVVDDTEAVLQMTAEMLKMFTDAEICCFQSPKEALRAFEDDPSAFGLVVTDFDMPEMNGAELCSKLRAITPDLKIILATGSVNMLEAKAFNLGFAAFLAKPFSAAAISSALFRAEASSRRILNSAPSRSLKETARNLCA